MRFVGHSSQAEIDAIKVQSKSVSYAPVEIHAKSDNLSQWKIICSWRRALDSQRSHPWSPQDAKTFVVLYSVLYGSLGAAGKVEVNEYENYHNPETHYNEN